MTLKQRAVFTRDEIKILLNLPDENYGIRLRGKVLLALMYATDGRAYEIYDLKISDVRMNGIYASIILLGKGSKTCYIGMSKKIAEILHR